MTYELADGIVYLALLFWSVFYVARRRMGKEGFWELLEEVGLAGIVILGIWFMSEFPEMKDKVGSQTWEDWLQSLLIGIGWLSFLEWLSWPSFPRMYCRTCWWKLENGKCGNSSDLGCDLSGTKIDNALVRKCLNCGGYRSRLKDLRMLGIGSGKNE